MGVLGDEATTARNNNDEFLLGEDAHGAADRHRRQARLFHQVKVGGEFPATRVGAVSDGVAEDRGELKVRELRPVVVDAAHSHRVSGARRNARDLARCRAPRYGWRMEGTSRASRGVAYAALAGVSLIAGFASWLHAHSVIQAHGAGFLVAISVPFLADLVILGASASLLAASRAGESWPPWDVLALAAGAGMTLAMNVAVAEPWILPSWLIDAWPPVAFILALESLAGMVRRGRGTLSPPGSPAVSDQCRHGVPAGASQPERVVAAWRHATECEGFAVSFREIGRQTGVHHATVAKLVRAGLNGDA